ncbi:MAG: MFS transporter [Rhodospirillales bacterium]|nr:MFS transporter [Rhodospirillales bacterium]
MPIPVYKRNVGILATCQALLSTGLSMVIILGGLVGATLSPDPALATLPVSIMVLGTLSATLPASFVMKWVGRRNGFLIGVSFGFLGAVLTSVAVFVADFALFCFGGFFIGANAGFGQFYRFAAADTAPDMFRSRAISLVLAGGVVAAIAGPELVKKTQDFMAPIAFLGSYLTLTALPVLAACCLAFLDIPASTAGERRETGRPLAEIARQPAFFVAVLGGMVGYGVMSLVMTATPLAMIACGFGVHDAANVIQWHVLAMFAPSFFTGAIIARFGVLQVMLTGMILLGICVVAALAGIDFLNFGVALIALGLGWNFAFVGASTLLTETHRVSERAKVQGINDFLVFGSVAAASFSSGALLHWFGWDAVQLFALPFVAISSGSILWLIAHRRRTSVIA